MKFSCKTQELLSALQLTSRAISSQQALPILGNVLIEVEGRRCTVSATDLELSIITSFPADIENEGSITVPAKALLNFAQYNSDIDVLLETSEGTQLQCSSPSAKTTISGELATEYPTITPVERETSFTLRATALLESLNQVTFASAKTTLRPVLSGVFLKSEKDKLFLVATDSYRLSECSLENTSSQESLSCIIPTKVLEELKSTIAAHKGEKKDKKDAEEERGEDLEVSITLSQQQIELRVGETRLLSRLIDGKFPDYQQIIPKETKTEIVLPVRDFSLTIKRMHYFAKETNNNLTFTISKDSLSIVTAQTQAGQDEALLPIETKGEENKIALSSSYLLDFLSHTTADTVVMKISDSMHPAVFTIPGRDDILHLIMPLRIQEN